MVFDIDGVLADFVWSFSKLASNYFLVKPYSTGAQMRWAMFDGSLSRAETDKLWEIVDTEKDWWENVPPLFTFGDQKMMFRLVESGYGIMYVTNRSGPDNVVAQTENWLNEHGLPTGVVISTKDKPKQVSRMFEDGSIGTLHGIIEDSPRNLEGFAAKGLHDKIVVMDRPYNRDVVRSAARASTVSEFCWMVLNDLD